uniref:hypothetical protein n=1 Tax=Nocardioides sp. Iso805N TaxID=1283287 RepID=UPI0003739122
DDFGAARAYSLEQTTHPWRLCIDADEWIADREQAAALFDDIGQRLPNFAGSIDMLQARADGTLNDDVVPTPIIRLVPRHVTFTGRVHEQATPEIRGVRLGLLVGHDGYTDEAKARKEGRNVDILIASLEDDPSNAYLWYQLAAEFFTRDMYADAITHLIQAYNLLHPENPGPDAPVKAPWWHRVSMRLVLTLIQLDRLEEAVQVGEIEARAWPDSSDFFYAFGLAVRKLALSLRWSEPERAEELAAASTGLWTQAVEMGDRQEYTGVLGSRATVLAARLLVNDYETLGRSAEAERYRRIAHGEQLVAASA